MGSDTSLQLLDGMQRAAMNSMYKRWPCCRRVMYLSGQSAHAAAAVSDGARPALQLHRPGQDVPRRGHQSQEPQPLGDDDAHRKGETRHLAKWADAALCLVELSLLRARLICCFLNGHAEPLDIPLVREQPDQCARSGYNIRPMHAACFDLSFSGVAYPGRQSLHLKH